MNKNKFKKLIKSIISETVNLINESIQSGEWWIESDGSTIYADGDVGDQGHQSVVIHILANEILSHFNIQDDNGGMLDEHEDSIKQVLIDDGRLSEEELEEWDVKSPSEIILRKLIEDKAYPSEKQANEALYIAYGGTASRDPRDYAMEYLKWKVLKIWHGNIDVTSWHLTSSDLISIVRGLWDVNVMEDGDSEEPILINVTVQATGKRFNNIPFEVLEKKMPQELQQYQSGINVGYNENINENFHHHHRDYRLYEGNNRIIAIFEDNSRLQFEVHFRNTHGEDKEKWRRKAFSKWKSLAHKLYNDKELTEQGNEVVKSWKECFKSAMNDPEMIPFIRNNHHQKIFP